MALRLGIIILFAPTFVLPALIVAAFGGFLGQMYIKAQLSVKREMSTAKAPVLGILGGAIAGLRKPRRIYFCSPLLTLYCLASIRAYHAQEAFKQEIATRINRYMRTTRTFYNLNL